MNTIIRVKLQCDTMKGVHKAYDLFVCFGTKPNKGLNSRSSTWPEADKSWKKQQSWKKEPREKAVGEARRRGTVDNGQQKEAVRDGQSGRVGIPSSSVENSLEIHACVSLQMHRKCNVTELPFLRFELTDLSPYCSFVLCSFSTTPSVVFLVT